MLVVTENDDTDEAARATVVAAATIDSFVMMLVLWLQGVHATSNCVLCAYVEAAGDLSIYEWRTL